MIGFLTGDRGLRRMRDSAHDYADSAYDPSIYSPSIDASRRVATQGIGVERMGEDVLSQIMRGTRDHDSIGVAGSAGRALAATGAKDEALRTNMSDVYGQLYTRDQQARMEAEGRLAEMQGSARQVAGRREAAKHEADMMYKGEKSKRRQQLLGLGIQGLGSVLDGPIGGAIAGRISGSEDGAPSPGRLEQFSDVMAEPEYDLDTNFDFGKPYDTDIDPWTLRDTGGMAPLVDSLWYTPGQGISRPPAQAPVDEMAPDAGFQEFTPDIYGPMQDWSNPYMPQSDAMGADSFSQMWDNFDWTDGGKIWDVDEEQHPMRRSREALRGFGQGLRDFLLRPADLRR